MKINKNRVVTFKAESIDYLNCHINQASPGDLDLHHYLPLHLKPQEQASLLLWKSAGGQMAWLVVISSPSLNHLPCCSTAPSSRAAASPWSHHPSQRLCSRMKGTEMSTWLVNREEQTALEPGNLQECRAAVLLSQLQTCFARGSSLCRAEGMRRVLPSRTSVLQANGKSLSHQQS